jgi:hypothetical protein
MVSQCIVHCASLQITTRMDTKITLQLQVGQKVHMKKNMMIPVYLQ